MLVRNIIEFMNLHIDERCVGNYYVNQLSPTADTYLLIFKIISRVK